MANETIYFSEQALLIGVLFFLAALVLFYFLKHRTRNAGSHNTSIAHTYGEANAIKLDKFAVTGVKIHRVNSDPEQHKIVLEWKYDAHDSEQMNTFELSIVDTKRLITLLKATTEGGRVM